jgi:hypothetical protein
MIRFASLLAIALTGTGSRSDEPLRDLRIELPRVVPYPGEPMPIALLVTAGAKPPSVRWPSPPGATIVPGAMELRPLSTTAIGDIRNEVNRYRFPALLIPSRDGLIGIPPISVGLDGAERRTSATRLRVRPLPPGRPSTFRGGVGPIRIRASASPSSVRVGQNLLYEIAVEGPGAWGSTADPITPEIAPAGLEPLSDRPTETRFRPDPPARTFRARFRATSAGSSTFPPVLISTLDPASGRYLTSAGPSVSVRVADLPALADDAVRLPEPPRPRISVSANPWIPIASGWILATVGVAASCFLGHRRARPSLAAVVRREARRLLVPRDAGDPRNQARAIVRSFAGVAHAIDPSRGVGPLGIDEWRDHLRSLAVRDDLADRGADLLERATRVIHAPSSPAEPGLSRSAHDWLRDLARSSHL